MSPSVSPSRTARLTLLIGISALSTFRPESRASATVIPTRPSGGSVNIAYVVTRPARLRDGASRIWLSWYAVWVNAPCPFTSPSAQTPGTEVANRSSICDEAALVHLQPVGVAEQIDVRGPAGRDQDVATDHGLVSGADRDAVRVGRHR